MTHTPNPAGNEPMYLISESELVTLWDGDTPAKQATEIRNKIRTRPAPQQEDKFPMLLRSCFGDYEDCPCDDECVVSEYCAKYHEDHQKNSCGMTDSQCGFVQNYEKNEAGKRGFQEGFKEGASEQQGRLPTSCKNVERFKDCRDTGACNNCSSYEEIKKDGCAFRAAKLSAMYDNGYKEGADAERESVLDAALSKLGALTSNNGTTTDFVWFPVIETVIKELRAQSPKKEGEQ